MQSKIADSLSVEEECMHMRPISITCKMVQILVVYVERSNLLLLKCYCPRST